MSENIENLRAIFSINLLHSLVLVDARERVSINSTRSSIMYREFGPDNQLLAHYRIWHHAGADSGKADQNGWEKYTPDGVLVDREVRYVPNNEPDITLQ